MYLCICGRVEKLLVYLCLCGCVGDRGYLCFYVSVSVWGDGLLVNLCFCGHEEKGCLCMRVSVGSQCMGYCLCINYSVGGLAIALALFVYMREIVFLYVNFVSVLCVLE